MDAGSHPDVQSPPDAQPPIHNLALATWICELTEPLAGALAVLVGCTTLMGGAAHYGSVLAGKRKQDVERMTGAGFFIGMVFGIGFLLFDTIQ